MDFKNKIIRYTIKPASDFLANPYNPRRHPERQRRAVKASLETLGWVAPVIVNARTGYLIDGHERVWQALAKGDESEVPCLEVDLDEAEEKQFLITFDAITYMAEYDDGMLANLIEQFKTDNEDIRAVVADIEEIVSAQKKSEDKESKASYKFTKKIVSPAYEPRGEKPALDALVDTRKYDELLKAIDASGVSENVKGFLRLAATRHIVFNYSLIADFYAHSDKQTQELFEKSALVIVDFDDAIAEGYVRLTKTIRNIVWGEQQDE